VWAQHETLEDYTGNLTEQLSSLLRAFNYASNIPVKNYTFKDGKLVAKYRVVIMLPEELVEGMPMPNGEGRSQIAAYHEAVVHAMTTIRKVKANQLIGTSFMAIPHEDMLNEVTVNHPTLVKTKPRLASKLLDYYRKWTRSSYTTHRVIVEDKDTMLEDFTDPQRRKELDQQMMKEVASAQKAPTTDISKKPFPTTTSMYSPTLDPVVSPDWKYPVVSPNWNKPKDQWEVSSSELPIENSDGWRWDLHTGTAWDPIPCYDTTEEVPQSAYIGGLPYANHGENMEVISISSDEEEEPMEVVYEDSTEMEYMPKKCYGHSHYSKSSYSTDGSPSQHMGPRETRDVISRYLRLEGRFLSGNYVSDHSGSEGMPPGIPNVPKSMRGKSHRNAKATSPNKGQ
jgi:hypothetical protein